MAGNPSKAARDAAARAARIRALQRANTAARAIGDDIPRPRPVAEAQPAPPASDATVLPPLPQLSKQQVNAMLRKLKTEGLTLEEMYWLSDAGAIPDSALKQLDKVQTSSVELPDLDIKPQDNLSANTAKGPGPKEAVVLRAKDELFGLTGSNSDEAIATNQLLGTLSRLDKVLATEEGKKAFYDLVSRNVSDPQGAIDDANARIARLRSLAGDDPDFRDAARIDAASQSRDSAGQVRRPQTNPVVAGRAAESARSAARASLPDSIEAIASAFNELPPDVRAGVAARAVRQNPFLTSAFAIDPESNVVSIPPEAIAELSAPRSTLEQLMNELRTAQDLGDAELEAAVTADIRREMDSLVASDPYERDEAIRRYQEKREAQDSLRREVVAANPEVSAATSAARRAAVSPGQPRMRAPGARSVEVAGPDLSDAEMPSMFDDSLARMREQASEFMMRQSNPLTADKVEAILAAAKIPSSSPPLALTKRLENRAEYRDRGGVSNAEQLAIANLLEAEEDLATAPTPESIAAAEEKLAKFRTAFNRTFGGKDSQMTVDAEGNPKFVAGYARSDSSLNRDSPNETYWSLLDTILGRRLRSGEPLSRSDVEFSAAERAINAKDAQRRLGYDPENSIAADMMPQGGDLEDLSALGEGGKRGRLGGNQRLSRVQRSFGELFGEYNPLDKSKFPEFEGLPEKVAQFLMRRPGNPRIEGSPEWNLAMEDLSRAVSNHYLSTAPTKEIADAHAVSSRAGDSTTATALSRPLPGPKPNAADVNLDSSRIDISDAADDIGDSADDAFDRDQPPGARRKGGRKNVRTIDAEKVEKVEKGKGGRKKQKGENAGTVPLNDPTRPFAPKQEELRAAVNDAASPSAEQQVRDAMRDQPDLRKADGPQLANPKDGSGGGGSKVPPNEPGGMIPMDGETDPIKAPKKDARPPSNLRRWLLAGAALGSAVGVGTMLGSSGSAGGESVPPLPPSGGGAGAGGDGSDEPDIDRILERIRGARSGPVAPTYQTLQNWTVWR